MEELQANPDKIYNNALKFLEVGECHLDNYEKIRALKYPEMNNSTRLELSRFYDPYNQKLYDFLNHDYNWIK
jgi:hypothetical protein